MNPSGKNGLALLLIVCGGLILLSKLGFMVHGLMGILFPLALSWLGYYSIKRGRTVIGWILLVVGVLALLSKLSGLVALFIAVGFIYYGMTLLSNKNPMETEV